MSNLRTNLDTYRVVADILEMIRSVTRKVLTEQHGKAWEEVGIPQPMRGFLEQRRDREATIQWRLPDSHDLLDFAGFENLAEIILANKALADAFSILSHDSDLLRARFLELDAIQNRIAYIRPVSEVELEFAVSFSERLRRVGTSAPKTPVAKPAETAPSETLEEAVEAPAEDAVAPAAAPASKPKDQAAAAAKDKTAPTPDTKGKEKAPAVAHISTKELEKALEEGRDDPVLTALYNEVTRLAEALWSETSALSTPAWDRVRESEWYERSFSRLSLKPVSDFYALHQQAGRRLADGASRTELQELLQERRFGEVLMGMRELFRKHLVKKPAP